MFVCWTRLCGFFSSFAFVDLFFLCCVVLEEKKTYLYPIVWAFSLFLSLYNNFFCNMS